MAEINGFVHLHTHTAYSLLDGEGTVEKVLDRAKELGQEAMAITDHGNMFGVIDFYKEAKKQEIKEFIKENQGKIVTGVAAFAGLISYAIKKIKK